MLAPTMGPDPFSTPALTPTFCLVCGEQGGADVVANIILFMPLGVTLALQGWKLSTQLVFAVAVTLFIESCQYTLIPGRDASLSDVLFNTVGAAVGIGLTRTVRDWVLPQGSWRRFLQLSAGLFASSAIVMTGVLTQPQLEAQRYRSQWYRAALISVHLGDRSLPDGYLDEANLVRDSVNAGSTLRIRGTAGPRQEGFDPIHVIRAQRNQAIWMSGRRGDDLVFGYRPVGTNLRLLQPGFRLAGVMKNLQEGDPLALDFRRRRSGFDVRVNDASFHVAFHARDGWRLILPTYGTSSWIRSLPSLLWIVGLLFPFGIWMSWSLSTAAGAAMIGISVMAVTGFRLLGPPGWIELIGSVLGLLAGVAVQRLAVHVLTPGQTKPSVSLVEPPA